MTLNSSSTPPRVDPSARGGGAPLLNRTVEVSHASREVSWSLAHEALWPVVERALRIGPLPLIGTRGWLELSTGDPRRVGAIYLAADQWSLNLENHATAMIDAAHEVSAARDWSAEAQRQREHARWIEANPWAVRRSA